MRSCGATTLSTLMGLALLAADLRAQEALQVTLESMDARAPVPGAGFEVRGPLGIDFGFAYLRPYWPDQDFRLTLPPAGPAGVPILAAGGPEGDFAFIPRLLFNYALTPDEWGVAASGELIDVSGSINRGITVDGTTANLNVSTNTKIVTANLLEATRTLHLADWAEHADFVTHLGLEETVLHCTLGLRYTSVTQAYKSSLQTPSNQNSTFLNADQEFVGLGLTSSVQINKPLNDRWVFFLLTRGSILLGENVRTSQATTSIAGNAAASRVANISETGTEALPVGELEFGLEWGTLLARPAPLGQTSGPLVFVRVGVLGQVYGNVGLLSAQATPQDFSEHSLYLVGVTLLVGFQH